MSATSFFRGAVIGGASQAGVLLTGFVSGVLIARSTTPGHFGAYAVASTVATFISLITGLQLQNQVARSASMTEGARYLTWSLAAGGIGAVVVLLLSVAGALMPQLAMGPLLWLLPVVALQPLADALTGLLGLQRRAVGLGAVQITRAVTRPILVLLMVTVSSNLSAARIAQVDGLVSLTSILLLLSLCGGKELVGLVTRCKMAPPRQVIPAFVALILVAANWQMIQRTDLLCVGYFLDDQAAGRYQIALRLLEMAASLYTALMILFLPTIATTSEVRAARRTFVQATVLGAQILGPSLVYVAVWGGPLVALLFGPSYVLTPDVYAVLAIGLLAQVSAGPNGYVLMAGGRHRALGVAGVLVGITNLSLNMLLVPYFGFVGAATASSASFVLLNCMYGRAMQVCVGPVSLNNPIARWQLRYLIALGVSEVPIRLLLGADTVGLALGAVAAGAVFLASARSSTASPVLRSAAASLSRRQHQETTDVDALARAVA